MARTSARIAADSTIVASSSVAGVDGLVLPATSATPLYHQLTQALIDQIVSRRWPSGSELPSEIELSEHLGVSRGTLRRALADLARHRLVERKQGRGTFVVESKFEGSVLASYAFYRSGAIAHDVESKVLKCDLRPPSADLRRLLGLRKGEAVYELQRVQSMNAVPITVAASFFPASLTPELDKCDLSTTHLYALLEAKYDLYFLRAEDAVEPVLADAFVAKHLGVKVGAPVFRIERLSYGHGDRVREVRHSFMRGDRYKLRIDLR